MLTLVSSSCRWLDKLGVAAVVGHKRVFRHDFIGGYFALLDANQNPLPVSCTKIFMPYFMFVVIVEGLLVVSTVQEVGWNQSCVR